MAQHAVQRRTLDWNDPGGAWSLVVLEDVSQVMPLPDRLRYGGVALVLLALLGADRRVVAQPCRMAATQRLLVLGAALENAHWPWW